MDILISLITRYIYIIVQYTGIVVRKSENERMVVMHVRNKREVLVGGNAFKWKDLPFRVTLVIFDMRDTSSWKSWWMWMEAGG